MKKTLLSIGLLSAMAFVANAQDAATAAPSSSELKAGNVTVELNMSSPFSGGGATPFELNNNVLRFRYFTSETMAFRLGFSIDRAGFNNTYGTKIEGTDAVTTAAGTTTSSSTVEQNKINVKSSEFQFSIMPGVEFHKLVSDRLSVYYGGYVEITSNSKKSSLEVTSGGTSGSITSTIPGSTPSSGEITNFSGSYKEEWKGARLENFDTEQAAYTTALGTTGKLGTVSTGQEKSTPGFFRYGLIGVTGADFYFTKGLYLGVELGWGFTATNFKAVEYTRTNSTTTGSTTSVPAGPAAAPVFPAQDDEKSTDLGKNKSGLQLAPFANAQFRLGFRF
jgi:hypothetical protein